MSQFLKYLDHYEEKDNVVLFYLKNYPSSRKEGKKIIRELYIYLFHDETLQLNRVHDIDYLTYKVEKIQQYFCLNCETPIFFEEDSNYITTCEYCSWRNELDDTPAITPITLKTKTFEDYSSQICYPLIEEEDLRDLPEKLRHDVETWFQQPHAFTKEMYQNIYHNLYKKDLSKMIEKVKKLKVKLQFAEFFKTTNFLKHK